MVELNMTALQATQLDELYALRVRRAQTVLQQARVAMQQAQDSCDEQEEKVAQCVGQIQRLIAMPYTLPDESVAQMKARLNDRDLSVHWLRHDLNEANELLHERRDELQQATEAVELKRLAWQRIRDRRKRLDEAAAENAIVAAGNLEAQVEVLLEDMVAARCYNKGVSA